MPLRPPCGNTHDVATTTYKHEHHGNLHKIPYPFTPPPCWVCAAAVPGVLLARRTHDRVETRRLLQHRRQRSRAPLRLLAGDARLPGLHQGGRERPLDPSAALPRTQGWGPMVSIVLLHTMACCVDALGMPLAGPASLVSFAVLALVYTRPRRRRDISCCHRPAAGGSLLTAHWMKNSVARVGLVDRPPREQRWNTSS